MRGHNKLIKGGLRAAWYKDVSPDANGNRKQRRAWARLTEAQRQALRKPEASSE